VTLHLNRQVMSMRIFRSVTRSSVILLAAGFMLAACAYSKPNPTDPSFTGLGSPGDATFSKLGGEDSSVILGIGKNRDNNGAGGTGVGSGLGINAYLWRGALDTLGFMPLASADPFGGVIITDWYIPAPSNGERFKATAYILGKDLRSDSVRVSVFRQVLQDGQWVDAPVSRVTVSEIENKVLDRARKLREQALANS
jgi:hypothetical protein